MWWVFSEYGKYYADLLPRTAIFLLIDMVQYAIMHILGGIVCASSNGYLVAVTGAKRIVFVTSLTLNRYTKIFRLHRCRYKSMTIL